MGADAQRGRHRSRACSIARRQQQWQVDPASCHAQGGRWCTRRATARIGYGELVDAAANLPAPQNVPLKDPKDFKLIGTAVKRLDSPEKVDGTAMFGLDVRVPGMVYAAIANCPVFGGTLAQRRRHQREEDPGRAPGRQDRQRGGGDRRPHVGREARRVQALVIEWNEGAGANLADEADRRRSRRTPRSATARWRARTATSTRASAMRRRASTPCISSRSSRTRRWSRSTARCTCAPTAAMSGSARRCPRARWIPPRRSRALPADKIVVHNHLLGGGFGRRLEIGLHRRRR